MSEPWIESLTNELFSAAMDGKRLSWTDLAAIIERHHAPCALSAKCAAERVTELTAIARYLMAALHAAAADPHDDTWAIARDAAMKWPELAPGSAQPTNEPRRSSRSAGEASG